MDLPYLGEIQILSFQNPIPQGWAACNGQLLPINQNQGLFSILGTMYGGDGRVNFALPDLRSRMPVMDGAGLTIATKTGTESETLNITQVPTHVHGVSGLTLGSSASAATLRSPVNAVPAVEARGVTAPYSSNASSAMGAQAIAGFAPVLATAGSSQAHANMAPYLAMQYVISLQGIFPNQDGPLQSNREPFVGEIMMFAGDFTPAGWARCEGQLLPVSQNTALFSLLGTYFGGNGITTFGLPNLAGKTPVMSGSAGFGTTYDHAQDGGVESVTLLPTEIPVHSHPVASGSATPSLRCFSGPGNSTSPVGNVPAAEAFGATATYRSPSDGSVMSHFVTTQAAGGGQPHNNRPPSLTINFLIAMQGIFPPPH
jgi:microcystin-dependent protein